MGSRFLKLNLIDKSHSYLHSISSYLPKNSIFTLQKSPQIHPLTGLLQFHVIHHPHNSQTFKRFHFDHFHHELISTNPKKSHKNSIFTLQNPHQIPPFTNHLDFYEIHHLQNSQSIKRFHFDHFHHETGSKNHRKVHKDSIFTLKKASTIRNPPNFRTFKRGHFGHSHHDHGFSELSEKSRKNENVFRWGLAADVGLTVGKAITGYLSGSTAIIADAAHSLSDVVLSGVALLSYKAARVPRDKEHPYGHGKFETLGALGISGMLLVTAGGIAWHAVDILLALFAAAPEAVMQSSVDHHEHHHGGHSHQIDMSHPFLALNMAVLSIGVKECLFWITKKAGDKEGSGLMIANAWHHRADAISSFVALIGVGGAILGVRFLDPLAGLVVSGMILRAGLESGHQSILELVDAAIPQQLLDSHRKTILKVDGVKGCHRLRGRRAGSFLHLDVHIEVDSFASVSAAHHIGENVRRQIHKCHPEVAEVFIHIDPLIPQISPDIQECVDGTDERSVNISLEHNDINAIISGIFSSQFSKRMTVEHIRPHLLRNKILLDVEVSMPSNIMISDAMLMAEEAKKEILRNISNAVQVNIQLRLSQPNHHTTP